MTPVMPTLGIGLRPWRRGFDPGFSWRLHRSSLSRAAIQTRAAVSADTAVLRRKPVPSGSCWHESPVPAPQSIEASAIACANRFYSDGQPEYKTWHTLGRDPSRLGVLKTPGPQDPIASLGLPSESSRLGWENKVAAARASTKARAPRVRRVQTERRPREVYDLGRL